MSTVAYKCPCCGAPITYSGEDGKLKCDSCDNTFELDAIQAMDMPEGDSGIKFDFDGEKFSADDAMQVYICKNCGAELTTDSTTTATECPYCGSPTVLPDRISNGVKPQKVVPFTVTKEQAQQQFNDYFKGKKLLPNIFLNSANRISEIRKLFVPYWLFNCDAEADIVYDAEKVHTERRGEWEIERTDHFVVRRRGTMCFDNIPVDGSEKLDDKISESLEPYDYSAAVPFQPAVLAGSMADSADVDAEQCEKRAVERVERSMSDTLRNTVNGYNTVRERDHRFYTESGKVTPALMPVWLITTEKEGKTYTFAINGQTGKLTCDVPVAKGKAAVWGAGVFAGVTAIAALVLYLVGQLTSGTIAFAVIAALLAAIITVCVLIGQLKQAHSQSAASEYAVKGSFNLRIRNDRFLYQTTKRRKIETNNAKK